MDQVKALLRKVIPEVPEGVDVASPARVERLPCNALPWLVERAAGEVYCSGGWHTRQTEEGERDMGRCPRWRSDRVKARIDAEAKRLAPTLERLDREGGHGWHGFDRRNATVATMYETVRRFSMERPPRRGIWLRGGMGCGKSRLLLAAYFDFLGAGVNAWYVTPFQLRRAFEATRADDERARWAAEAFINNVRLADVVLFDEVGMAGDQRFVGDFRERLWDLLETTRAVFAVATNLDSEELEKNPDIGPQNLSRLVRGAEVVLLDAPDWRTAAATVIEVPR